MSTSSAARKEPAEHHENEEPELKARAAAAQFRLEILDKEDRVLKTHRIKNGLTLVGTSPGAHVHLSGTGVGPLHIGIRSGTKDALVMDLGGPTRLKINGKEAVEQKVAEESSLIEIGNRKLRLKIIQDALGPLQSQTWAPVTDAKNTTLTIRVRIYAKSIPLEVTNAQGSYILDPRYSIAQAFKMVWLDGGKAYAQLPHEWISLGGRIRIGKDRIGKLADWAKPVAIEHNVVYRISAGFYLAEILVSAGAMVIGKPKTELLPQEMRKPLAITGVLLAGFFSLWAILQARQQAPEVEEPYGVYARIQNVPIEVLPEPEPATQPGPQGGGGSGGASEATAPEQGPTKFALRITGGLRNLVGSVLSSAKVANTGAVVSEIGSGQAAMQVGTPGAPVGQLAAVSGKGDITSAGKLGKLALAGSGQGFSGGSGTGLGQGYGSGIGNGVGGGIGTGGNYRVVEEETFVDGGLDKSLIAAVIQNNLSQIKYCYERQLVAEPDLFGKVVVTWNINGQGTVENTSIKQSTLNSPPVEQCVMSKISKWKFPLPKNGSKVTVSYPFLFKSTK